MVLSFYLINDYTYNKLYPSALLDNRNNGDLEEVTKEVKKC